MTKQEIRHLADLSKLEFSDRELAEFEKEFNAILDFVSEIEKAKVADDIYIPHIDFNDLRPDEIKAGLTRGKVLSNAPVSDGEYYVVPQVVE